MQGQSLLHRKAKSPFPAGCVAHSPAPSPPGSCTAGSAPGMQGQSLLHRKTKIPFPAGLLRRRFSPCRFRLRRGDARGGAPCIRKLKISPFPGGEGGRGDGGKIKTKVRGGGRQERQAPPPGAAPARRAGEAGASPPAGHEICFLLRRLKINPVAVAFFEKPLAFLRKIWYNTIQSCTVACSCARKPARV